MDSRTCRTRVQPRTMDYESSLLAYWEWVGPRWSASCFISHLSHKGKRLSLSDFQMTVEKAILKLLLQPITTGVNNAINQSEFVAIIRNLLKARVESHLKVRLVLVLLLICWKTDVRYFSQSISAAIACAIAYSVIDSHLKTAHC